MQPAQVVILGAGRSVRGGVPSAIVDIDEHGRVLDWQLDAFAALGEPEVAVVGGFRATDIVDRYPGLRVVVNQAWAETGPVESLARVELDPLRPVFVSYGDVVFRRSIVTALAEAPEGVALAVDSTWRARYDGRAHGDLLRAEKVAVDGGKVRALGADLAIADATAEFAGVLRLSPHAAVAAQRVMAGGDLPPTAALPALVRALLDAGIVVHAVDLAGEWAELDAQQDLARFVLGTKAESLARLQPMDHGAVIGSLVSFTRAAWNDDPDRRVAETLAALSGEPLIVRSSALTEDAWGASGAGRYESIADVPRNPATVRDAVDAVFASYADGTDEDQVLVQEMVRDVVASGVVMTRTHALGAPYTVVNFDLSSRTDVVTSGGDARSIVCLRGAELRADVPGEIAPVLSVVHKIERLVGHDSLDIEFAVTSAGEVHILQVRPIAIAERTIPIDDEAIAEAAHRGVEFVRARSGAHPHLLGASTRYSVMTDWNPAEIVGTTPRALALSLYRDLVTDEVWARQRAEYGYRDVRPCPLLVEIAGHPYVDVRACFNSFVPAALDRDLAARLVDHQLAALAAHPQSHDKVEFDVLATCLAPGVERRFAVAEAAGFSTDEIDAWRTALLGITLRGFDRLDQDLAGLAGFRTASARLVTIADPLERAAAALDHIRRMGTLRFAHLARGAFVATSLLRGLVSEGALRAARVEEFLATTETVFGRLQADAGRVRRGEWTFDEFVDEYGHLRPGTYDITSPPYAARPDEYLRPLVDAADGVERAGFAWSPEEGAAIGAELGRLGLPSDLGRFEHFVRGAIAGRELGKFEFTRPLSLALESIAEFGDRFGLSREDLANIRISDLLLARDALSDPGGVLRARAVEGRELHHVTQGVALPGQIVDPTDVVCFEQERAEPNFVTQLAVEAPAEVVGGHGDGEVAGRIVLIPSADPGYDWLLARDIAGLVTMFGGANSHMAVRAAEIRLPAAVGVGEARFEELVRASVLRLDCGARTITVVR